MRRTQPILRKAFAPLQAAGAQSCQQLRMSPFRHISLARLSKSCYGPRVIHLNRLFGRSIGTPPALSARARAKARSLILRRTTVFLLVVGIAPILPARGDTWIDAFDSPEQTWWIAPNQHHATLRQQERVRLGQPSNSPAGSPPQTAASLSRGTPQSIGAERLLYECQPGFVAWFWCDAPPAAVIEELSVIADLRTTVPGVLLAVEVTLPRTIDSETGRPRRVVVRQRPLRPSDEGDIRLVLDDLPRRLQARARVLRVADSSRGDAPRAIDTRGSYVSRIGLAAPGDYRPRELWTKRLSIENLVRPPNLPTTATQPGDSGPLLMSAKSRDRSVAGGSIVPTRVTVDSEGFRIDGRGFIPRAWRWRGESLELLAERGFNTVWFDQPLDRATLEEASLRRLHLLAPPPSDPTSLRDVSLAPVLAWVIPGVSTERNVDTRLVAIEKCRALPADQRRPILVETNAPKKWARIADGLLIDTTTSRLSASDRLEDLLRSAADRSPPGTLLISIIRADLGTPAHAQGIYAVQLLGQQAERVTLELAPELHYGQPHMKYTPSGPGMVVQKLTRDTRLFDELEIEVDLAAGELLVVTALPGAQHRLGGLFHHTGDGGSLEQKYLLLRLSQVPRSPALAASPDGVWPWN